MLSNFPQSTRAPWEVISTFGPTPSGAEGFTAIVPVSIYFQVVELIFSSRPPCPLGNEQGPHYLQGKLRH